MSDNIIKIDLRLFRYYALFYAIVIVQKIISKENTNINTIFAFIFIAYILAGLVYVYIQRGKLWFLRILLNNKAEKHSGMESIARRIFFSFMFLLIIYVLSIINMVYTKRMFYDYLYLYLCLGIYLYVSHVYSKVRSFYRENE